MAPTIPEALPRFPIDLPTALRLADDQNPEIAVARVAIMAATAEQLASYSILLPTLNGGPTYHAHSGNLLRSTGQVLNVSSQSFYVGAGARTWAAETLAIPGVNIYAALTDAIYRPLAANQAVIGARFQAAATANDVLLDVSTRYIELLGAQAVLASWQESAAEADEIVRIVQDYFLTGQGRKADADRAETERRLFQADIQHAEELVAVASARLSERLNLDASIRLEPPPGQVVPLKIVDVEAPVDDLIRAAVRGRPDLAARQADVDQAEYRHKRELARPWLPTVWVGFSGGYFGGGSNIVPPSMGNFSGRQDFDARLFWTVLNGGFGNLALQRQQHAEVNQAIAERVRVLNRARDEVTSARAEALAQRQMVETARLELTSAEDGYREDRIHLRESLGRPIEVVNSLRLLARARVHLIEAITRANQAQFALFVALGTPPPLGPAAGAEPAGPPPIANPLNSPLVTGSLPLIPVPPPGPPRLGK
jgi:outer membrane protein TolC